MTTRRTLLGYGLTAAATATALAAPLGTAQAQTAGRARTAATSGTAKARPARVTVADGTELFVKDWGDGPVVVLTHAWPFNSDCWDHHACALADAGYRVISYDRRGFGRSSQPSGGYDYNTFADDLAAVINAAGVSNVTLVGYSMGGGEVIRYISRHGSKQVARLALVGSVAPGLVKTKDNPNGIDASVFEGIKAGLRSERATFLAGLLKDAFYDVSIQGTSPVTQQVLDWSLQMSMQAGLRALISSVDAFGKDDFRKELSAVTVPTLIVHGSGDKPVPFELTARQAAKGISQATLIDYKGASHGILVTERDRVTADLLKFLKA